jgi:tRNA (adenine37-N6)-methyltransferase
VSRPEVTLTPVGTVRCTRQDTRDDDWDRETAQVDLDPERFSPDALQGLAEFSHVEVIFHLDRVAPANLETGARHPRGNAAWPKVGIFAQRASGRPNRIGATVCRILEVKGTTVRLEGLDAADGSPVLDLKPWVAEFGPRGAVRQPAWATQLMRKYWRYSNSALRK